MERKEKRKLARQQFAGDEKISIPVKFSFLAHHNPIAATNIQYMY